MDSSTDSPAERLTTTAAVAFSHPADARSGYDLASIPYGTLAPLGQEQKGAKIADHALWSSQLDKIERFLVGGDRRGAYHYAADEKLWAHALLIASSVDKEAWKEVVTEFARSELANVDPGATATRSPDSKENHRDGREPLRVAYSLFAGLGAASGQWFGTGMLSYLFNSASVQELHPQKPLGDAAQALPVMTTPLVGAATPMSAAFAPPVQPVTLPIKTLAKWPQTATMIISGTATIEASSALTSLGDHLAANNWIEAAHAWSVILFQKMKR